MKMSGKPIWGCSYRSFIEISFPEYCNVQLISPFQFCTCCQDSTGINMHLNVILLEYILLTPNRVFGKLITQPVLVYHSKKEGPNTSNRLPKLGKRASTHEEKMEIFPWGNYEKNHIDPLFCHSPGAFSIPYRRRIRSGFYPREMVSIFTNGHFI